MSSSFSPSDPRHQGNRPADEVVSASDMGGAQVESRYASYTDETGNQVERQETIVADKNARRANLRYWLTTALTFLFGALEVILALRFLFRLLGANQGNAFVMALYHLSQPFVAPFHGIFSDLVLTQNSIFEVSTLIAMAIYALIAWGLVSLVQAVLQPNLPSQRRSWSARRRLQ